MFTILTVRSEYAIIPLTKGKYAVVDLIDLNRVLSHPKWWAIGPMPSGQYYAETNGPILMHRMIMRPNPMQLVDHIKDNGVDNRRSNLRICDKAQNAGNGHKRKRESGIKGVHWHKAAKKYCAQIRHRNRRIYLGLFEKESDAAKAYDTKARELWGEFANTNY